MLTQDVPFFELEGAGRSSGTIDQFKDGFPLHQGGTEEVQDARGRREDQRGKRVLIFI